MAEDRDLEILRLVFLKAEQDIINELARLRAAGLIDYHKVGSLERVRKILRSMEDDCWTYVPRMVEKQFYVSHPERYTRAPKSAVEHFIGYQNASNLSAGQLDVVNRLVMSLMSNVMDAEATINENLTEYILGRRERDTFRDITLLSTVQKVAAGTSPGNTDDLISSLKQHGLTAFVDKSGRKWSLYGYANMACRTTAQQARTLAALTMDPEHDLYKISKHGTTCALCAPYEGRVYSKSGKSSIYPPLADAFGKIDPAGPNELTNTYLNIHPNCLHVITPFVEAVYSKEELAKIREFSSPVTNPYDRDPRSEAQIKAYRKKEDGRRVFMQAYREWKDLRLIAPGKVPKTFQTFLKHKMADDDKYHSYLDAAKE